MATKDTLRRAGGTRSDRDATIKDLRRIPGIGPSLAGDLWDLGYRSATELRGEDPQAMYERLMDLTGVRQDPCVLYTFRCAVYWASEDRHNPELLKWWNWKGRTLQSSAGCDSPDETPGRDAA